MSRNRKKPSLGAAMIIYLISFLISGSVIALTHWVSPGLIPLTTSDIWSYHNTGFGEWMLTALPLLGWGFGASLISGLINGSDPYVSGGEILVKGATISAFAGIFEELAHRWLSFLGAFGVLAVTNYLLGGFVFGTGLPEWLHNNVWGHLADWTTFGMLHDWIYHPGGWLVGAAMLYSNAVFRDGHKYQGWFGYINSWFIGMYLFYIMFHHGLLAAILVHFAYDMVIFTVRALLAGRS